MYLCHHQNTSQKLRDAGHVTGLNRFRKRPLAVVRPDAARGLSPICVQVRQGFFCVFDPPLTAGKSFGASPFFADHGGVGA